MAFSKIARRAKIKKRIRKNLTGTETLPRLTVYRSNKQIYAQVINDLKGETLVSASSQGQKECENLPKIDQAKYVGKLIAEKAIKANIEAVKFDRNGYLYHGRVKSLADGAREGGLKL
ncbi:50S ribosomal protein L18 [Brumimicrobium glaciale]|jgi:large subunit ribosomal protein L18|uniref:Large ribosomal subunit protein uL18 n=1 Tax=Brumimicrobium glaciale TaxID=200475 RepID=A0A4V1WFA1_9FLAO|nr:50S ribosomal protein L18 [Brumimicrobium glaciale]RYM32476.1 50S ribosomal protein L18 [Brumimicrobium glaciale]